HQGDLIRPQSRQPAQRRRNGEGVDGAAAAQRIWQSAEPLIGTLAETYLRSRGIDMMPPASLRFNPALRHPAGGLWPAMIALVTRGTDDEPLAIHRTYLARDGGGKAPVDRQKLMFGPCRGGA